MKKGSSKKKRILFIVDIIVAAIVVGAFIICFFLGNNGEADYSFDEGSIYDWGEDWVVSDGSAKGQVISLPENISIDRGKSVILKKTLPNKIKKYNCLMYEGKRQDIMVHVGGVLRYSYTDKKSRDFGHSSPDAIILVPIYSSDEGSDITMLISSDSSYSGEIGAVYLGNEKSLILNLIKKNIVWAAVCLAIAITGLVCLVCFFLYRNTIEDGNAFIYLFAFSILAVIFCVMKLEIRQVFISDIRLIDNIGYLSFMLMPIFMMSYTNWITKSNRIPFYIFGVSLIGANFTIQSVLQMLNLFDFNEMAVISTILFLSVLVMGIMLFIYDQKVLKKRLIDKDPDNKEAKYNRDNIYIFGAAMGLLIPLIAELIGRLIGNVDFTGPIYTCGFMVYIFFNVVFLILSVSREEQRRRNAENASVAKSQFLATMSHEIRTPINAVLGMNEMISRETTEKNIREYSGNIADAGKSLLSLVNDILDFSKIESGKMDIVCVEYQMKSLLSDLVLMIKGRVEDKGLKLILNIDENIPSRYYGDEVRIKQILTNIMTNSAKYTPSGSITVTVENRGIVDDEISLYFSIKDTGIGIKSEDIDKLMNSAFIRVDAARNRNIEGTGLGLSITRQLLTLMGSELKLSSVYGEGSDFYFELKQKIIDKTPMGSIKSKTERSSKKKAVDYTIPDARILAVDDTKTNILVIKGLLKPYKCHVVTCDSGEKCINLCKNETFDIIFMDHMMPEMDGIETLKQLKEQELLPPYTKVIALTANAISGAADLYRESGFDGYVTKPIDVKELNDCLKNNLDSKLIVPLESQEAN